MNGFLQPGDTHARGIERDAGLVVLVLQPAGADAQLQSSVGEDVDRAGGHGQYDGVAEVVVEDEAGETQPLGGDGRGCHRRDRLEPAYEVVRPADGVIAERFDASHCLQPRLARAGAAALHSESKRKWLHRSPPLRSLCSRTVTIGHNTSSRNSRSYHQEDTGMSAVAHEPRPRSRERVRASFPSLIATLITTG